jgi:hypothetical protein
LKIFGDKISESYEFSGLLRYFQEFWEFIAAYGIFQNFWKLNLEICPVVLEFFSSFVKFRKFLGVFSRNSLKKNHFRLCGSMMTPRGKTLGISL